MSDTLVLPINQAFSATEFALLATKRKPAPGKMHVLTVGDGPIPFEIFFYDGPEGASSLTNVRKLGAEILITGKVTRDATKPLLFASITTSEIQDGLDDYGYAGELELNTTEARAEFPSGDDRQIFWEIVVDGIRRHQWTGMMRPRVWTGDEPDPTPALEGLMQQVLDQATAATAAAEAATTASANKADKITGGTTDNLVKRDAGGNIADAEVAVSTDGTLASNSDAKVATEKAVKTYAAKKAANPANALPGEAVDGADLRVNATGGMRISTGGGLTSAMPSAGTSDFGYMFVVKPATNASTGVIMDATAGLKISRTAAGAVVVAKQGGSTLFTTANGVLPDNTPVSLCIQRTAGTTTLYAGGASVGSAADANDYGTGAICFGFDVSSANSYLGDCHLARIANFAMTDDEAAGAAKGESRGRLAFRGYTGCSEDNPTVYQFGGPVNPPTSWSYTGGTLSISTNANSSNGLGFAFPAKAGVRYRYSGTLVSRSIPDNGFQFWPGIGQSDASAGYINDSTPLGPFSYEVVSTSDSPYNFCAFQGASGAPMSIVIDDFRAEQVGTVASYEPGNCTPNGWADLVGGYHLRNTGGATALNPQGGIPIVISGTVAGATVTAGTVASIGTFTPTPGRDAAMLAGVGQWDAVSAGWTQARPANAGNVIATATAAGTVVLEGTAHGSNATISASTAVKIVHTF